VAASAAELGAADLAASGVAVASASSGSGSQAATGLTEAVLVAFRSRRLVNRWWAKPARAWMPCG
jgi:hypothetical protein